MLRTASLFALASLLLAPATTASDIPVRPGESIQAAVDLALDADRIVVYPGVYNQRVDLLGKRVELVSLAGPEETVLDGTGLGDSIVWASSGEPDGALVRGFTLIHGAGHPFPSSYGHDYYGGAVFVGGGARLRVEECFLFDNATTTGTFAGGAYVGGTGSRLELVRCVVRGNHAWACGGATLVDHSASMRLERCTVFGNTSTSFFGHQGGVSMANGGQVELVSTIVWGNSGSQIAPFGAPYDQGTSATAAYCDVQGGFLGTGNVALDPNFVDPAAGDLRLQPGSPCIDAGDPSGTPDLDGSPADIGALGVPGACGEVQRFCPATATSDGSPAELYFAGSASLSADDVYFVAVGCPADAFALPFYGSLRAQMPFARGVLCVGSGSEGLFRLGPPRRTSSQGELDVFVDTSAPPAGAGAGMLLPGSTWRFQVLFRDRALTGPGPNWNLTRAVEVRLCP